MVQLSAPASTIDKPESELKAFGKKVLRTGSLESLTFRLNVRYFASFIDEQSSGVAEKGTNTIKIGASSTDIKTKRDFTVASNIIVEKVHDLFELDIKMETLQN